MTLLLSLLLAAAGPARADQAPECVPLMSVGCYLERPGAPNLLIYHRGYVEEPLPGERRARQGRPVPPSLLAASARQAARQYDLATAAAALDASLIVTGSFELGVEPSRYARRRRVLIAAHSGGVVGLAKTLDNVSALDGIALLDCFYGEDDGTLEPLGERVARLLRASPRAVCGGFDTPHNASRLRRLFVPALGDQAGRCAFDARGKDEHDSAVMEETVRALRASLLRRSAFQGEVFDRLRNERVVSPAIERMELRR